MIRFQTGLAALLLVAATAASALTLKAPHYPITRFTLPNGLRVVLSEDHSIPLVGVVIAYNVGARNEVKDHTGFAHLFEHMMFQGSAHVGKNEFARYIERSGGTYNGVTHEERTEYQSSVPSQKLPLILWMEADRMRSLAVTAENFANQKDVVKEEKRMRMDNQPYQAATVRLQQLAYTNFANQHLPIGSMEDLDAADLTYVQTFFHTYYVPNNAVLVLAGDFDSAQARKLIEADFGDIPRRPDPPKPDTAEPPQTAPRHDTIRDPFAATPETCLAWPGPSLDSPDTEPMDLLFTLLFQQETQRSWSDIGAGEQWVYGFEGGLGSLRGPSLFEVEAIHRPDISSETIKNEIFVQIERVKKEAPSKEEVERVKTRFLASLYRQEMEPLTQRASGLALYTLDMDAPERFYTQVARYEAVTPEQIQAVARKYLTPNKCTFLAVQAGKGTPEEKQDQ